MEELTVQDLIDFLETLDPRAVLVKWGHSYDKYASIDDICSFHDVGWHGELHI